MYDVVAPFHSRSPLAFALLVLWCVGCGGESRTDGVSTGPEVAVDMAADMAADMADASDASCWPVMMDGDVVVLQEEDVTSTFRAGEPYTKTVMLFGGEPVEHDNAVSNIYIFALDKEDALTLAAKYPDFYLCSSPGGQEAQQFILSYDLVPATCQVYEQLLSALRAFNRNNATGGDRVSLQFDGAPLELESTIVDATGEDVTDQLLDRDFHLVTAVEQLTGQSVLEFGTTE